MIAVALMTQGGFAGNLRYVALPAAMVCILAGAGWVGLVREVRIAGAPRAGAALAARGRGAVRPVRGHGPARARDGPAQINAEADLYGANLEAVIAKAGGEERAEGVRAGLSPARSRPRPSPGTCTCTRPRCRSSRAARDTVIAAALHPLAARPALPEGDGDDAVDRRELLQRDRG